MKQFALLAIPLLLSPLSACGQETPQDQIPAQAVEVDAAPELASTTPVQQTLSQVAKTQQQAQSQETSSAAVKVPLDKDGYEEIMWEDLMPEGEEERLQEMYAIQMQELSSGGGMVMEGSSADKPIQLGTFNVVDELNDVKVKLPGYTVPFDFSPNAKITEFLLVPYYGACLHAPPPPPNQTVYVTTDKPLTIGELDRAVWVRGTLKTVQQTSDLADTAYTLVLDDVTEYTY